MTTRAPSLEFLRRTDHLVSGSSRYAKLDPGHNETIQRAWNHRVRMGPGKIRSSDGWPESEQSERHQNKQKKDLRTASIDTSLIKGW